MAPAMGLSHVLCMHARADDSTAASVVHDDSIPEMALSIEMLGLKGAAA